MVSSTELISKVKSWSNRSDLSDDLIKDFLDITLRRTIDSLRIAPLEGIDSTVIAEGNATVEMNGVNIGCIPVPSDLVEFISVRELAPDGTTVRVYQLKQDYRSFVSELSYSALSQYGTQGSFARKRGDLFLSPAPEVGNTVEVYHYAISPDLEATIEVTAAEFNLQDEYGEIYSTSSASDAGTLYFNNTDAAAITALQTNAGTRALTAYNTAAEAAVGESISEGNVIGITFLGIEAPHWIRDNSWELLLYGGLVELEGFLMDDPNLIAHWEGKYTQKMTALRSQEIMREASGGTLKQNIRTGPARF